VEGLNIDGTTVPFTIRAADRFNNPAPDGTAVAFTTEGGAIQGNCVTSGGACSVNWVSQNPRPAGFNGCDTTAAGVAGSDASCAFGPRAGRSTVLATAVGEESFIDLNGNGAYDDGEPFTDLGEAFRDDNGNGKYDSAFEEFLDFNSNGKRDPGNGKFTGTLCNGPNQCDPVHQLNVRQTYTLIMSGSSPVIDLSSEVKIASPGTYDAASSTFTIPANQTAVVSFVIRDYNDQPMPSQTTVALTGADAASVSGTNSHSVPCTIDDTAAGNTYSFIIKAADQAASNPVDQFGSVELKITTPGGTQTFYEFNVISKAH
jgi:hypothetical protein